jgi:hypothetical protein
VQENEGWDSRVSTLFRLYLHLHLVMLEFTMVVVVRHVQNISRLKIGFEK